jgi:hypothetical protein
LRYPRQRSRATDITSSSTRPRPRAPRHRPLRCFGNGCWRRRAQPHTQARGERGGASPDSSWGTPNLKKTHAQPSLISRGGRTNAASLNSGSSRLRLSGPRCLPNRAWGGGTRCARAQRPRLPRIRADLAAWPRFGPGASCAVPVARDDGDVKRCRLRSASRCATRDLRRSWRHAGVITAR